MTIHLDILNLYQQYSAERVLSKSVQKRHKFSINFLKTFTDNLQWTDLTTSEGWINTIPFLTQWTKERRLTSKRRTIRDVFSVFKTYSKKLNHDIFRFIYYVRTNLWEDINDYEFETTTKLTDDNMRSILNTSRKLSSGVISTPLLYHSTNLSNRLANLTELAISITLDTASRPSELLTIPVLRSAFYDGSLHRRITKGSSKGELVQSRISSRTSNLILDFIESNNIEDGSPLFDISKSMLMTGSKTVFCLSGVNKPWMNLHRIRGYATSASARGGSNSIQLQSLGRWSDPGTPQKHYIDKIAKQQQSNIAFDNLQSTYAEIKLLPAIDLIPADATVHLSGEGDKDKELLVRRLWGSNPRPPQSFVTLAKRLAKINDKKYSYLY
jgi:hypothetical protein